MTAADATGPYGDRISHLRVPSEEEQPDEVRGLIESFRERLGFAPNIMPAFSLLPGHFMGWWSYFDDLMRGNSASNLSKPQREMIAVVVSAENHCHY